VLEEKRQGRAEKCFETLFPTLDRLVPHLPPALLLARLSLGCTGIGQQGDMSCKFDCLAKLALMRCTGANDAPRDDLAAL